MEVICEALKRLAAKYGTSTNSKGYKVLPDCIRLIQGDGIDLDSLGEILDSIMAAGFSADNVAFGMGGGLLQRVDRDTLSWAMKASAADVGGLWRDVYKDPITSQSKRSKRGRLALTLDNGRPTTVRLDELAGRANLLQPVFHNGKLLVDGTLADVRQRVGW